jgi:2-polyprenyl-6-methoxyphenol hydroxylase-like FAD-dependent oxidoreductase
MIPQSTTEAVLEAKLVALGSRVHRGVAALSATREREGAIVRLKSASGERTIRARFVVGADGMHSMVRQAAGIAFHGEAYGSSFILADVRMDWPLGADEVSLFFSSTGLAVVAPLPDGSFRVVATLDDAPDQPDIQHVQRLLNERGPRLETCRVKEVVWGSRFRVHHRLAERYRSGPFLLMGDAAHVHSPAGGQGMNTGLVDAILLGEALTRVIRDGSPTSVLDDYARMRRPAAEQVLALAARLTRIATLGSPPLRRLRNLVLRLLNCLAPFKRSLALTLSGIARRRFSVLPAPASFSPSNREAPCSPHLQARPPLAQSVDQRR